ncbi:MAG: carboxymuconolactone decarboxylase family protein [Chloroflexota bacterium]
MSARINFMQVDPEVVNAMSGLSKYWMKSEFETSLIDLVLLRASQINHCAYCIDMHFKDARASGETEQRLYSLDAWRETPFYSDRERAALAWTEAVTLLTEAYVPDEVYEQARQQFTETELLSLTLVVIDINGWNRLNVSLRSVAGYYKSPRKPVPALNGVLATDHRKGA